MAPDLFARDLVAMLILCDSEVRDKDGELDQDNDVKVLEVLLILRVDLKIACVSENRPVLVDWRNQALIAVVSTVYIVKGAINLLKAALVALPDEDLEAYEVLLDISSVG